MEKLVVKPLALWSIEGHDVLLDTAHDLLKLKNGFEWPMYPKT